MKSIRFCVSFTILRHLEFLTKSLTFELIAFRIFITGFRSSQIKIGKILLLFVLISFCSVTDFGIVRNETDRNFSDSEHAPGKILYRLFQRNVAISLDVLKLLEKNSNINRNLQRFVFLENRQPSQKCVLTRGSISPGTN